MPSLKIPVELILHINDHRWIVHSPHAPLLATQEKQPLLKYLLKLLLLISSLIVIPRRNQLVSRLTEWAEIRT